MEPRSRMYIGGDWVDAADDATMPVVNPATEVVLGQIPKATRSDLDAALASAERGWKLWRSESPWNRAATLRAISNWLRDRAEDIAEILTEEQGKPLREATSEVVAAADYFDWFADEARRVYGRTLPGREPDERGLVIHQPVGPVAAFTPWNFPAVLPARKLAAALAAGCSVILKPAEETPRTVLCLAQACEESGLPPGVVNIVTGDPNLISSHLIQSGVVRKVSLTGSVDVGRQILERCSQNVTPVTMELGGHAPAIVFADSDVAAAAELACQAKFRNSGQVCISPSRFLVDRTVEDEFIERFCELSESLRVGPGHDPSSDMGPLSNERRLRAVEALIGDATAKGATVHTGGTRPETLDKGYFFSPTVLSGASDVMDVMSVEPFGPIAPISTFDDVDEAIDRANSVNVGLAGYIFTRDLTKAFTVSERLEVGMVGVNSMSLASSPTSPFGGIKQSGFGREGGSEGIGEYCVTKYINMRLDGQ